EIKPEIARQALTRVINEGIIPSNTIINNDAWQKAISLRKDVGDLKISKNMSEYVDNSFAQWAEINCNTY
ncbi:MAG TPA: hypothetical protein VJY62_15890, partial [Bacteroidia bacterium]|nr:hypothetical protein [Bacteroidia bacterium]